MRLVARVTRGGEPLQKGKVELVGLDAGEVVVLRSGRVTAGRVSLTAEAGPAWGLRIDGLAVLATPLGTSRGETLDLGEIALLPAPLELGAFHAPDGRVHGVPAALAARSTSARAAAPAARATIADAIGAARADETGKVSLSIGTLLGSAAEQLRHGVALDSGFALGAASVKIKGVPTTTADALGLILPSASELASGGAGMSEVTFDLRPSVQGAKPTVPIDPAGPALPELIGYSRELALRKLAAFGYVAQVRTEIVSDPDRDGRVIRQIPKSGTPHAAGAVVSLFVARKAEGK